MGPPYHSKYQHRYQQMFANKYDLRISAYQHKTYPANLDSPGGPFQFPHEKILSSCFLSKAANCASVKTRPSSALRFSKINNFFLITLDHDAAIYFLPH